MSRIEPDPQRAESEHGDTRVSVALPAVAWRVLGAHLEAIIADDNTVSIESAALACINLALTANGLERVDA